MSKIHYAITRLTAGGALFIRVRFHHAPLLTFTPPNNSDLFDFPSPPPTLCPSPPPPPFPIILRHARAITFDRRRQTTIRPDRLRNRTHCVRILASRIDGSVFRERSTRLRGIRGANGTCPTWEARPARLLDSRWGTHMLAFVPLRAGETKTSGSPSPWSSNEPRSPPGTHLSLAATTLVSSQSRATIFVSARRHVPPLTSLPFFLSTFLSTILVSFRLESGAKVEPVFVDFVDHSLFIFFFDSRDFTFSPFVARLK